MPTSHIAPARGNQDIAALLVRIRDLHHAAQQTGATALHLAMDAGDALIQVQKQVSGCPWKRWLAANCSVPVRTVLLYMQLARHRSEIESNLEELSIRAALRLITKTKPRTTATGNGESHSEVSLESLWAKKPDHARTAFCDAIGVSEFCQTWSFAFRRELEDRIRIEKFETSPDGNMTVALWTALSLLGSIDEPSSSDVVRRANINALLTALRTVKKKAVHAAGKEVALSFVDVGTVEKIRAAHKRKRAA